MMHLVMDVYLLNYIIIFKEENPEYQVSLDSQTLR